jgi:hypothetical protein
VILSADTLGSYGSLAMFKAFQRIKKVLSQPEAIKFASHPLSKKINEFTVLAASGDMSDFQFISQLLDEVCS